MALKLKYKSNQDIPAELRPAYVERNGEWIVDVEGTVPADELARAQQSVETLTTQNKALHGRLHVARTEEAAVLEARRIGLRPGAETDIRHRARNELTLDDQGNPARLGPDGKLTPVSVTDWVAQQSKDATFLFSEGEGSGAAGVRARTTVHTGPNPWAKGSENWTQQAQITKADPALAAQLKQQAATT